MDRRIRVPKQHEALLARLVRSEESPDGVFGARADALTFAAAYGYAKGVRSPFTETADPIRMQTFENRGHDTVFYLLGVSSLDTLQALSPQDEWVDRRATAFEEYANGGLELLNEDLRGVEDVIGKILLIIGDRRPGRERELDFDLRRFLK